MKRALLLLVGIVLGVGTPATMATFKESAGTAGNSIVADPDWVAPPVDQAHVIKSQGGKAGYVRPGGSYYLCADIGADSGNPASGLRDVTTDLTRLTNGLLGTVLGALGAGPPCSASVFDVVTGPHTVKAGAVSGTVGITTRDNDGNTRTATPSVTVDGAAPAGTTSFFTTNAGATAGKAETNDFLTFTYGEPIDPHSVIAGWDGTQRSDVFARIIQAGNNDSMDFWRQTGPTTYLQIPVTATTGTPYMSLGGNYVTGTVTFSASKLEVSGNNLIVRLGTPDAPGNVNTLAANATSTMTWRTSSALFDWAGNLAAAQTLTEAAPADKEF